MVQGQKKIFFRPKSIDLTTENQLINIKSVRKLAKKRIIKFSNPQIRLKRSIYLEFITSLKSDYLN